MALMLTTNIGLVFSDPGIISDPISTEAGRIGILARNGNYKQIEDIATLYAQEHTKFPDGKFRISVIASGIISGISEELFVGLNNGTIDNPDEIRHFESVFEKWRLVNKKSAIAAIAQAQVWNNYAWKMRGSGYANSVSPEGWKAFAEFTKKAEKILIDTKDYSSSLPIWYELMASIQLPNDRKEFDRYYREGVAKFPWYFPLHFQMIGRLLPQWGGSIEEADKFITGVAKKEGDAIYTRLYWAYAGGALPADLFKETKADWPRMKRGFIALMKETNNNNWTANNFAKFACIAGDKAAFRQAEAAMKGNINFDAWGQNISYPFCKKDLGN